MSKPLKDLIAKELNARYGRLDSAVVVNPIQLTGNESNDFRRALRAKSIRMELVKNSLARRALADTSAVGVAEVLDGPCAIVTGGESIVDVAREIIDWTKKLGKLQVRGALVEGQVLDAQAATDLAKLPTRIELQGQIVELALSGGSRVVSSATAPGTALAGCIKALIEKLEQSSEQVAA